MFCLELKKLKKEMNLLPQKKKMEIKADLTKNDGTYADNVELSFNIDNQAIAAFKDGHNKLTTDSKGLALVIIKGISKGNTPITATSNLDGENKYGNINIEVIE